MDTGREANQLPVGMEHLTVEVSPETVTVGRFLPIISVGSTLTLNMEGLRGIADSPWEVNSEPLLAPL